MSSLRQPVLFLDFDRTLFDTERFYEWLGPDRYAGILALMSGKREAPDFAQFLYADTLPFLQQMKGKYHLVMLSYTVNVLSQRRKIRGAGVTAFFEDILITKEEKGIVAKSYLSRFHQSAWKHVFVDDVPEHLANMKKENPHIHTILIDRTGVWVGSPEQHASIDETVSSLPQLAEILARLSLPR